MTRILIALAALAGFAPIVSAGIEFTSPKAGATLTAGSAIEVEWKDGGEGPKLADLLTYELFLCAGSNDATGQAVLIPITTSGSFVAGNKASGMVGITVGESIKNAYFLKMVAVAKKGGVLTTYSSRFSYSGMNGVFPAAVKTAVADIDGTDGPATEDATTGDAAVPGAGGDYGVEYTMQTGLTRFAPMQPVPATKMTKKDTKPLFPTSSVAIAKTRLPIPKVQTTITQSQTFSVSSIENTVAPAPHATDDMAKFLNRWKD